MSAKLLVDIPTINWAYTVPLERETEYTFGTSGENRIKLPSGSAAERHAVVAFRNTWTVQDCGSATGTFVNGQAVAVSALRDQDVLRIGTCEAVFQNRGEDTGASEWNHTHRVAQERQTALASVVDRAGSGKLRVDEIEQALGLARPVSSSGRGNTVAGAGTFLSDAQNPEPAADLIWSARKLAVITAAVLSHPGDREQTYRLMLQHLREAIDADNGFVMIPDQENMRWIIRAWIGDSESWSQYERTHPLPLTVTNRAYRNMSVVSNALQGTVAGDDEPINSVSLQQLKVNSYIAVPLRQGGQRRGVLYFDTRTPARKFGTRDVRLLELAGNLLLEIEDQRK